MRKDYPRPAPPIPAKFKTIAEFGKAIGWGTYDAAARERARTITRSEVVSDLELTVEIAQAWLKRYVDEVERKTGNPSANGRIDYTAYNRATRGVTWQRVSVTWSRESETAAKSR